jgi:hypothetical protein
MINKLLTLVKSLKNNLLIDPATSRFIKHNRQVWSDRSSSQKKSIILVDFYDVAETLIAYSYFLNPLAKKLKAQVKSFSHSRLIPNYRLHQVYRSFNVSGHVTTSLNYLQKKQQRKIFQKILPTIKTKKQLFQLKVLGVWIGIDIYESYLKHYNQPTVDFEDLRLSNLIKEGIGLTIFWQDYFKKNKVKAVIVSHDCYVHLNILNKVAYQNKISVYLPNIRGIFLVKKPFSIYSHLSYYPQMFKSLSNKEKKTALALGKQQLQERISGQVGAEMPHRTRSAFHSQFIPQRLLKKSNKTKILISTHCFYDNPHAYRPLPFPDFYEWLHFLGQISQQTNYDWYLKPHPDPLPGTLATIKSIVADYPQIKIIPYQSSVYQLAQEGLDFALTIYGSIGHEYPALGIQVINASYNPHIAYNFNWHAKTIKEYRNLLFNLPKLSKKINLQKIYEFYYLHYYYVPADDLILKSYRQSLTDLTNQERISSKMYQYFLNQFSQARHKKIIKNMEKFVDSGKSYYFSQGPEN